MTDQFIASHQKLFTRDLNRLKKELEAYKNEADIWKIEGDINNSAGNLALHLIGNLKAFIGTPYANTGYVRDREREFLDKNVALQEILKQIDETIDDVNKGLGNLDEATLNGVYPYRIFKEPMTTSHFLIHLYGHLNYHLGQVNYHRRLVG